MKSILKTGAIVLMAGMLAISCDVVEPPYVEGNPNPNPTDTVVKKILLEDFTGHLCPNCPSAAVIAHQLQALYPGRIVMTAVHSGYFAGFESPDFMYDFTCTTGDELHSAFNITNNPIGAINRLNTGTNNDVQLLEKDEWGTLVESLLLLEPDADINLNSKNYNSGTRLLEIDVKIDFFTDITDPVYISAYLTEDNIIKPQKNSDPTVGTTPEIDDYDHMHVLRGSMNGTWGEELTTTATSGSSIDKTISYTLPASDWDVNNMHIVVFIYNQTSGEVIQSEEIKLN